MAHFVCLCVLSEWQDLRNCWKLKRIKLLEMFHVMFARVISYRVKIKSCRLYFCITWRVN